MEEQAYQIILTDKKEDFRQIKELNWANCKERVDEGLWASDGFLTLEFDTDQLERMRGGYKHVVAKSMGEVVGYALVLIKENRHIFPFFDPMFETINLTKLDGMLLSKLNYFVMAQICVHTEFRGKGVFSGMYKKLAEQMSLDFDKVVIEVSPKNVRSMKSHLRVGFEVIKNEDYQEDLVDWNVMILSLK